jgi:hypothetical protein
MDVSLVSRESNCAVFAPGYGHHMLPSNTNSPPTLVFEGLSVGVGGSVRDERIFVKSIGTKPNSNIRLKRSVKV